MDIVLLIRIAITLTFFILAAGGPYALIKLVRFIARYTVAHDALKATVQAQDRTIKGLEARIAAMEKQAREKP